MLRPIRSAALVVLVMPLVTSSAQSGGASTTNVAKLSIASGPDQGTYTLEVPPLDVDGRGTCHVRTRADGEAGSAFAASFYPAMKDKPGLMETLTFNVGPGGSTKEIHAAITFLVGRPPNLDMRVYEVETRPDKTIEGRGSATLAQRGPAANVRVEAKTPAGVKFTLEIECRAVSEK